MTTKRLLMGYCLLYAVARFVATTVYYFGDDHGLQLPVLIVAEAVSLIGILLGLRWVCRRFIAALTVRLLLLLYSAAAIANILITRASPLPHGVAAGDLLIIGTLFELLLFFAALLLPMPDVKRDGRAVKTKE